MGDTLRGGRVGEPPRKVPRNDAFEAFKQEYLRTTPWAGSVDAKMNCAAPYHFFLTRIKDAPQTHDEDLSITFPELLDSSLGDLEDSLHINFLVELPWLLAQYAVTGKVNPLMTIIHGEDDSDLSQRPAHLRVTAVRVRCPSPFGHHHTKMSVFYYKDKSVRIVVSTANLVESDWENRTQGIWISPKCPYLGDRVPINYGESETLFKVDIIRYLNSYRLPELRKWLERLQQVDMSDLRVCFIASVPGEVSDSRYGLQKLSKLIKQHVKPANIASWRLVAQCSSIGSLGKTPETWLFSDFARSLVERPSTLNFRVELIYPSLRNVRGSHDGMLGGACLPYQSQTHFKQQWLNKCFNQWKSDNRHRSKAVPHIKTYTKVSPDGSQLAWFLLTSANLSKAAWGSILKSGACKILSYEAGVLFLPIFLIGKDVFQVKRNGNFAEKEHFPLPYDAPLTKYEETDSVFLYDKCFK